MLRQEKMQTGTNHERAGFCLCCFQWRTLLRKETGTLYLENTLPRHLRRFLGESSHVSRLPYFHCTRQPSLNENHRSALQTCSPDYDQGEPRHQAFHHDTTDPPSVITYKEAYLKISVCHVRAKSSSERWRQKTQTIIPQNIRETRVTGTPALFLCFKFQTEQNRPSKVEQDNGGCGALKQHPCPDHHCVRSAGMTGKFRPEPALFFLIKKGLGQYRSRFKPKPSHPPHLIPGPIPGLYLKKGSHWRA